MREDPELTQYRETPGLPLRVLLFLLSRGFSGAWLLRTTSFLWTSSKRKCLMELGNLGCTGHSDALS